MSERPDRLEDRGLWVVEVTAPLASGRVREVAADAAARLKLPVEKLVALLENRIGPVTKPLPRASAARVAEVLDLSGAEVALRQADVEQEPVAPSEPEVPPAADVAEAPEGTDAADAPDPADTTDATDTTDVPDTTEATNAAGAPAVTAAPDVPPPAAEPSAPPSSTPVEPAAPAAPDPPSQADDRPSERPSNDPTHPPVAAPAPRDGSAPSVLPDPSDPVVRSDRRDVADVDRGPASPDRDEGAPSSGAPPPDDASLPPGAPPVLGRAGRGLDGDAAPPRAAPRDAWFSLDDDRSDEDEAMLGRWTVPSGFEPRAGGRPLTPVGDTAPPSRDPEPTDPVRDPEPTPSPPAPASTTSPSERASPAPPRGIAERPPVAEHADDEDPSWAYGLRDPFADAEARERRLRRWTLMIALLVASTIFVALQWAYSRPGLGDATPPSFAEGLAAYREGAFVSAARLWTPRAEAGDAEAMFLLGWMAEYGQGRPWSNREAASWYRQAAERGHARAQLRLADLYRAGLGVEFDEEAALRWYLAAAEAGEPRAQREAALALAREGRRDEARAWLARAADGDDPVAVAWWSLEADGAATPVSP